jgi:glycosyltransferase involved in cell wall biosynthesis
VSRPPLVSIVIPTYNSRDYLRSAIDSVLAQTVTDIEVIVVDDGSTDDTPAVTAGYGTAIRAIRQANQGVAMARNNGIAASRGRFLALLDADDTWLPRKLELQVEALRERSGFRGCTTAHYLVDASLEVFGTVRPTSDQVTLAGLLLEGNVMGSVSSMLCERSLLERSGGFDPALSQCADWDMWIRLVRLGPFLTLQEPLVTYRWHGANMSLDPGLLERDSTRVLEKAFDSGELGPLQAVKRRAFGRNYTTLAGGYFHAGQYREGLRCVMRALALDPGQLGYMTGAPLRMLERVRSGRSFRPWPWSQQKERRP